MTTRHVLPRFFFLSFFLLLFLFTFLSFQYACYYCFFQKISCDAWKTVFCSKSTKNGLSCFFLFSFFLFLFFLLLDLADGLKNENPCFAGSGEYPDPTNCSQLIKCFFRTAKILPCPTDLIFNAKLKVCDYPIKTPCDSVISENGKVWHLQLLSIN